MRWKESFFHSDLVESGEAGITCSAQAGTQEVGVCTTVIKATLGIANSTHLQQSRLPLETGRISAAGKKIPSSMRCLEMRMD